LAACATGAAEAAEEELALVVAVLLLVEDGLDEEHAELSLELAQVLSP
jgi:hypothetical protein